MESFDLLKMATAFITPLGLALLLALLGLAIKRRWLVLIALAWLWLWSTPWAAERLARTLEKPYPLHVSEELPTADVILVLGGGLFSGSPPWWHPEHNLTAAGDRVLLAEKLWRLKKAPVILYSGGPTNPDGRSEAKAGVQLMGEAGIPPSVIVQEPNSRTTRENATFSMPLLQKMGAKRVLLVTSVWHMERSLLTFRAAARKAGLALEFIPAPCDPIELSEAPLQLMQFTPNTGALDASRMLFKEWLGIAWARWVPAD